MYTGTMMKDLKSMVDKAVATKYRYVALVVRVPSDGLQWASAEPTNLAACIGNIFYVGVERLQLPTGTTITRAIEIDEQKATSIW